MRSTRRAVFAAVAAAALLGACQQGGLKSGKSEAAGDMALGSPDAPVTVIEYASITCGVCKHFHDEIWPTLKERYVETGKVRFILREYTTPPAEVSAAGFQLARCGSATPEQYFSRIETLFDQQQAIMQAAQAGQARQPLLQIAKAAGVSESQLDACLRDEKGYARIKETQVGADKLGVEGTPTVFINGEKLPSSTALSLQSLTEKLDSVVQKKP